jgi:4-diphosphocytidyl-2-C-methyl-D-erythritol kinase
MRLLVGAPGKVNLCLFLGPRREHGLHEVVTVIESVSLRDELTISVSTADSVRCLGVPAPNLISTALERLRMRGWAGPPLEVDVDKRLPVAAGMGGGSADAAAMLRAARRLAPLPEKLMQEVAAELGADVPSQLEPGLVLATGAGERVQPLPALTAHAFVILPQRFHLSTANVYAEADRLRLPHAEAELEVLRRPLVAALRRGERPADELLVNDLEPAALSLRPEVHEALDAMRAAGAEHALVSGSGPTAFGLFWGEDCAGRAEAAAAELRVRFPGVTAAVPVGADAGRPRELA